MVPVIIFTTASKSSSRSNDGSDASGWFNVPGIYGPAKEEWAQFGLEAPQM